MLAALRVEHGEGHEASRVAEGHEDEVARGVVADLRGLTRRQLLTGCDLQSSGGGAARDRVRALPGQRERVGLVGLDRGGRTELSVPVDVDLLVGVERDARLPAHLDGAVEDLDLVALIRADENLELRAADLGAD